jgi:hypothetical protein
MKAAALLALLPVLGLSAAEEDLAAKLAEHREGAQRLAEQQDELAADVQQLTIEQTHPKVIELLEGVEAAMDDASGRLLEEDTGGPTIAAQTDVIERILAAAEEKQKQQGGGGEGTGGAMLDMMKEMAGKGKPGDQPGQQGKGEGKEGGQGQTGDSDSANSAAAGAAGGKSEARRVPKASGNAGQALPREFQNALDAYNRAAAELAR